MISVVVSDWLKFTSVQVTMNVAYLWPQ